MNTLFLLLALSVGQIDTLSAAETGDVISIDSIAVELARIRTSIDVINRERKALAYWGVAQFGLGVASYILGNFQAERTGYNAQTVGIMAAGGGTMLTGITTFWLGMFRADKFDD
jgi:hypothetical protein